ncbi:MAG TPA: hypothetical protein VJ790_21910 [Dongiaceae bacterium]|nr:hypothetical protein [Dongiaceae bacterium]
MTANGRTVAPTNCDRAAANIDTWKTIAVGGYRSSIALHDALMERGIHVGDLAGQMLRLPAFKLTSARANIELSLIAVSQLVGGSNRASFAAIHAHAIEAGFDLCSAEAGPQLRLQYPEQRLGEYLVMGMKPLPTADGSDACFVVGNGGTGLIIVGRSAGPDAMIASRSRFVFALHR